MKFLSWKTFRGKGKIPLEDNVGAVLLGCLVTCFKIHSSLMIFHFTPVHVPGLTHRAVNGRHFFSCGKVKQIILKKAKAPQSNLFFLFCHVKNLWNAYSSDSNITRMQDLQFVSHYMWLKSNGTSTHAG